MLVALLSFFCENSLGIKVIDPFFKSLVPENAPFLKYLKNISLKNINSLAFFAYFDIV